MISQTRPAYYSTSRISKFAGRSIDDKPTNVENGAEYKEIDTGRIYMFDAENIKWIEKKTQGG